MKAVILAGGKGTRLAEETSVRPKPLVEIGGYPILWHIMKIYSAHGVNDFIICLGYKGNLIKKFFSDYFLYTSDVTFDMANNSMEVHRNHAEPWRVSLIDTGKDTMSGGRLRRIRDHLNDGDFCFTYGDGVGDVDITASIAFHRAHGRHATVTAVRPPARFGAMELDGGNGDGNGGRVRRFQEKPEGETGWINGGFFVLKPDAIDYVDGDDTPWERAPLERLAAEGQLMAFRHDRFWHPMDTLRDREHLDRLWAGGAAPWKAW